MFLSIFESLKAAFCGALAVRTTGQERHYGTIVRQARVFICKLPGAYFQFANTGTAPTGLTRILLPHSPR